MKYLAIVILLSLTGCCYLTGNKCNLPKCSDPGSTRCNGTIVQICKGDGEWVDHRRCPSGTKCGEVEGVNACIK